LTREKRNTSRTCHRCGHVAQVRGRIFKCPKCGMEYDRDLNACVNIARRVTSSAGWGSREPPEPSDEGTGAKPPLNGGSLALQGGGLVYKLLFVTSVVCLLLSRLGLGRILRRS
jgi:predicted RNA-binding Zn-ribbon protein involved in translation (DUF1610 family)